MSSEAGITSYAQNFEDVILWRALKHVQNGLYVDIGAQDPVVDSVSLAFHQRGWKGIHVEPVARYAQALSEARPGDTVIHAAVSSQAGLAEFYEFPETGLSTLEHDVATRETHQGFSRALTMVPTITLSDLFDRIPGEDIHWLKIDVEGHEHAVLSSWGDHPKRPWVVVIESTEPLRRTPNFIRWEGTLVSRGYSFAYFDGLNRFYVSAAHADLASALSYGPSVFDDFKLQGSHQPWFCPDLAEALQHSRHEISGALAERDAAVAKARDLSDELLTATRTLAQLVAEKAILERALTITDSSRLALQSSKDEEIAFLRQSLAKAAAHNFNSRNENGAQATVSELEAECHKWWKFSEELKEKSTSAEAECHKWWKFSEELKEKNASTEGECHKWWAFSEQLKVRLSDIENSYSWRITAPLRLAGRFCVNPLSGLRAAWCICREWLARLLVFLISAARKNARLEAWFYAKISRFPAVLSWFRRFGVARGLVANVFVASAPQSDAELSATMRDSSERLYQTILTRMREKRGNHT